MVPNKFKNAISDITGSVATFDVIDCTPGKSAVAAYERDGVVCLRNAHSTVWLALIEQGINAALTGGSEDLDIIDKVADSGKFSSLNYQSGKGMHLANQNMNYCFRYVYPKIIINSINLLI